MWLQASETRSAGRVRHRPWLDVLLPASLRTEHAAPDEMARLLDKAGVQTPLRLVGADGRPAADLDIRLFRSGGALIAGIQRTDDAPGDRALTLLLPAPRHAQIVGGASPATPVTRLPVQLDPVQPLLLVLSAEPLPGPTIMAPADAALGELVPVRLGLDRPSPMQAQFVQVTVLDPAGQPAPLLSETVRVPPQGSVWNWPIAINDRPGGWQVLVTDALTGRTAQATVLVR